MGAEFVQPTFITWENFSRRPLIYLFWQEDQPRLSWDDTDQLIQDLGKNLLGEYLFLLKTCIACICDLLKVQNYHKITRKHYYLRKWKNKKNARWVEGGRYLFQGYSISFRVDSVDGNQTFFWTKSWTSMRWSLSNEILQSTNKPLPHTSIYLHVYLRTCPIKKKFSF